MDGSRNLSVKESPKKSAVVERIASQIAQIHDNFVLGSCFGEGKSPILHASKGFLELTGYSEDEVVGKDASFEFLLGPDTHPSHQQRLPNAVLQRTRMKLSMVLYRKAGTAFLGRVETQPIKNNHGDVILIAIGLQLISNLENPSSQFLLPHGGGAFSRKWKQLRRKMTPFVRKKIEPADLEKAADAPRRGGCRPPYLIRCNSKAKVIWDWLMMIATIYAGVTAPFNVAFYRDADVESLIGDLVVGTMLIIDILLNFRTCYYDRFGQQVEDPCQIARNYLLGWFLIDLISAFPYDLLPIIANQELSDTVVLLKCARLLRLSKLWVALEQYSEYSSVILAINMTLYILLAHWFACIWFYIGTYEYDHQETEWNVGWIYRLYRTMTGIYHLNKPKNLKINPRDVQGYWTSMYFSLSMLTTVGFGNEAAYSVTEKIACCIAMPIFALMHAVVFGNVTAIIQRMYARRFAYDIQQKELKDFYRIYNVPKPLKRKMREFYHTVWTVHRGISHEKILKDFPEDLKADICEHIYGDFLSLSIFQGAPRDCLKTIALHIRHTFINPGEYLIRTGDVLRCYYFICGGTLEVSHLIGDVSALVGKAELIGGRLSERNGKSALDVKAATYCDLHTLKLDRLVQCLSLYPEFAVIFAERLENQLAVCLSDSQGIDAGPPLFGTQESQTQTLSDDDDSDSSDKEIPVPPFLLHSG